MGYEMQWFETTEGFSLIVIALGLALIFAIASATVAVGKRRSGFGWFVLSLLFGPIILIIISTASPVERK